MEDHTCGFLTVVAILTTAAAVGLGLGLKDAYSEHVVLDQLRDLVINRAIHGR